MATACQFAAASSAPRLRRCLRVNRFQYNTRVSCSLIVSLILRLARGGLVAALLVAAAGWAVERYRFGSTDAEAAAQVETEVRRRFDAGADALGAIASRAAAASDTIA